MSCFINETGFYVENELNRPILIDYLKSNLKVSPEMFPVLQESFETCAIKVKEKKEMLEERKKKHPQKPNSEEIKPRLTCDHGPAKLGGCVLMQTFLNCPDSVWTNTDECNQVRDFKRNCKSKNNKLTTSTSPNPNENQNGDHNSNGNSSGSSENSRSTEAPE